VFVADNDIWYQQKSSGFPTRVTFTGSEERFISNGVADWLYEGSQDSLRFLLLLLFLLEDCVRRICRERTFVAAATATDRFVDSLFDRLSEEIFGTDVAAWWSVSGTRLAFITFNDTAVPKIQYPYYQLRAVYPEMKSIPYPKAGETLPKVSVHVWSKLENSTVDIRPPSDVQSLG
jgi:Dipeptidyl peptidase IV (DPP IV) N-terminal region